MSPRNLLVLCLISATVAFIQPDAARSENLIDSRFDHDTAGWVAVGTSAKARVASGSESMRQDSSGKRTHPSLALDYTIDKGQMNELALPTPVNSLKRTRSIHFWIKSDHDAPVLVILEEHVGGKYNAVFSVQANKWQEVTLQPDDFNLDTDKNAPKDPDGKLDVEQVSTISIVDLTQFFAQLDDPNLQSLFSIPKGPHTMLLSDFRVATEPVLDPAPLDKQVVLDTPNRPQPGWLAFGKATLSVSSGKPLNVPALQADYHQGLGTIAGFIHAIAPGRIANIEQIGFTAASLKQAHIIVQLEQSDGSKFNSTQELKGDSAINYMLIPISDFKVASDSPDQNAQLNLALVKQIMIIDSTGITDGVDLDNTLWIGNLHGLLK